MIFTGGDGNMGEVVALRACLIHQVLTTINEGAMKRYTVNRLLKKSWDKVRRTFNQLPNVALNVSLTRFCNARCFYCLMHNQNNYIQDHMDPNTFERVIEIYNKLCINYMVVHSMGEPLAHPEFQQFMHRLLKEGFGIRVSTNGAYIHKHMDTLLKIHWFRLSTDGWNNESMMSYRKQKFDHVYRNMKEFYRYSRGKIDYPVRISLYIHPSMNDDDIRQIFEIWGECADIITVAAPYNARLLNHEVEGPPIVVPKEEFGDFFYMVPRTSFSCKMAMKGAYIQPNGDVLPCCRDYAHRHVLGNINEEDFFSIFHGEKAERLRNELRSGDPESCGKCYEFYEFPPEVIEKLTPIKRLVPKKMEEKFVFDF